MIHRPHPHKTEPAPVAVLWEVTHGTHFPKVVGYFDTESEAVAESAKAFGRHYCVAAWAMPGDEEAVRAEARAAIANEGRKGS